MQANHSDLAERPRPVLAAAVGETPLTWIRFSPDDLALTRFGEAPAPLLEVSVGLVQLRRRTAPPGRWAVRARRAFPATARPLLDLIPATLPAPTFVDPSVPDLDEGLELANRSVFGLGSSIWTANMRAAHRAVQELEAGYTWVNALQIAHDELPFGGTKESGFGKEHGLEAFHQYTDQKSVVYGQV